MRRYQQTSRVPFTNQIVLSLLSNDAILIRHQCQSQRQDYGKRQFWKARSFIWLCFGQPRLVSKRVFKCGPAVLIMDKSQPCKARWLCCAIMYWIHVSTKSWYTTTRGRIKHQMNLDTNIQQLQLTNNAKEGAIDGYRHRKAVI